MNIKLVFRIQAILNLLNGIGALILTRVFLEAGNFQVTEDLTTLGQFLAVTLIILGIIAWRIPDLASDSAGDLLAEIETDKAIMEFTLISVCPSEYKRTNSI